MTDLTKQITHVSQLDVHVASTQQTLPLAPTQDTHRSTTLDLSLAMSDGTTKAFMGNPSANGDVASATEPTYLVNDVHQVGGVRQVTVVELQPHGALVAVPVDVVNSLSVEARRSADDAVHLVSLLHQSEGANVMTR